MQHVRFGALAAILVLSTVMLVTIDESQNSVLAQNITSTLLPSHLPAQDSTSTPTTTPALEPSGNDDESPSIDDSDNNNSNSDETSSSSGSDDDDNSDNSDSQQDTSSSEEEDDSEQTNPLLEQIRNNVNGALSASGIAGR